MRRAAWLACRSVEIDNTVVRLRDDGAGRAGGRDCGRLQAAPKRQSVNMGCAERGPERGGDVIRQLSTINFNQRVFHFCLLGHLFLSR